MIGLFWQNETEIQIHRSSNEKQTDKNDDRSRQDGIGRVRRKTTNM